MANGEWRIGMIFDRPIDQFVSGPKGVAGCHDLGRVLLSVDAPISSRRVVRIDIANQAGSRVSTSQYCGRSRSREYGQLRAASANFTGVSERVGNTSPPGGASRHPADARFATGSGSV